MIHDDKWYYNNELSNMKEKLLDKLNIQNNYVLQKLEEIRKEIEKIDNQSSQNNSDNKSVLRLLEQIRETQKNL